MRTSPSLIVLIVIAVIAVACSENPLSTASGPSAVAGGPDRVSALGAPEAQGGTFTRFDAAWLQ